MPGAFAHITLVNMLKETRWLDALGGFPDAAKAAVLKYFKYCELGTVSPDYPYLAIGDKGAAKWADDMHYTRTGEMIHAGVRRLRDLSDRLAEMSGMASWLCGALWLPPNAPDAFMMGDWPRSREAWKICKQRPDNIKEPLVIDFFQKHDSFARGMFLSLFMQLSIIRHSGRNEVESRNPVQ